jgi:hypothetical protein
VVAVFGHLALQSDLVEGGIRLGRPLLGLPVVDPILSFVHVYVEFRLVDHLVVGLGVRVVHGDAFHYGRRNFLLHFLSACLQ